MNELTIPPGWPECTDELRSAAQAAGCEEEAARLSVLLELDEIRRLLSAVAAIDPPERIRALTRYDEWQHENGGGFHGMLPAQLSGLELPVPRDLCGALAAARRLAKVRAENNAALRKVNPAYPNRFTGTGLSEALSAQASGNSAASQVPPPWSLSFDLSGLRALIELLERRLAPLEPGIHEDGRGSADAAGVRDITGAVSDPGTADPDGAHRAARAIASMPPFQEMMRHRRNLGYVPEPLVDTEGLARFIAHAASADPLDRIWRWLASQNFFDLADVSENLPGYRRVLIDLEGNTAEIEAVVLGTIAGYATEEMRRRPFRDRISFTVGWGIAGWATAETAGINIEHFKDDWPRLIGTLVHECVHRWQLWIGSPTTSPGGPDAAADSFEALTTLPDADPANGAFYTALSYIMLEGTATYIAEQWIRGAQLDPDETGDAGGNMGAERGAGADTGAELLRRCHDQIYRDGDTDIDELLNEGLRSNGPFYRLGAEMTKALVSVDGPTALGETLSLGAAAFVLRALTAAGTLETAGTSGTVGISGAAGEGRRKSSADRNVYTWHSLLKEPVGERVASIDSSIRRSGG